MQNLEQAEMVRELSLKAMIDSETVFNVVSKDWHKIKRRHHIDVLEIRQSYNAR